MKPAVRVFVVIAILLVTFGLPVLLHQVLSPPSNEGKVSPTVTITEVSSVDDLRFLSIPPILVTTNSTFMYKMVVASLSGDKVEIEALSKPDWMRWDPSSQQLTGPVPGSGGVFSVTMRAKTQNGAQADQTFTVTVEEAEVKGISTVGLWKDPFHPNLAELQEKEVENLPAVTDEAAVLGETTTSFESTAGLSFAQAITRYGVWGLIGLLIVTVSVIFIRIAKNNISSRQLARNGVVIERGSS